MSERIGRVTKFIIMVAVAMAPMLLWTGDLAAQAKTTNYKYDALGRLTYVEDSVNGNRDYDYDAAGNRLLVAAGSDSDSEKEPGTPGPYGPPAKPSGLVAANQYDCAWSASWLESSTATSYIFKSTANQSLTMPATPPLNTTVFCPSGQPSYNKPNWVQACNDLGCSEKSYFVY